MTDELPRTWLKVRLGDVCTAVSQRGPDASRATFKYIDLGAIDNKSKRIGETSDVPTSSAPSRAKQIVRAGDVVFSTVRVYLENIAEIPDELDGEIASTAFCVLRPMAGISSRFLYHYVTSRRFVLDVNRLQRGNSPPSVQDGDIRSQELPLPPSAEQKRIASRIDELFSRIDEGERALERVQKLVERYRQSVLKAAVTGELTRDWREKNQDKLESGEALLARILKARREAWEKAELDKMKAKGITPANDKWKQKYEEPAEPDVTVLPTLPSGWKWAALEQLSTKIVDGTHHTPEYVSSGIAFLSVKDIRGGTLHFDACKYISAESHQELSRRCAPSCGDLLITKSGTIGRTAIVNTDEPFSLFVSVALVKPVPGFSALVMKLGFDAWFQTINVANDITGTAVKNLHLVDLKQVCVPVPPEVEQAEILSLVDEHFSKVEDIFGTLRRSALQSMTLRQSTLKAAFCGDLLPQSPSDEPAHALLERIAAAHSEAPAKPKRGRKPKTSEPA